ncbi:MAG: DUF4265 domain-containing protein [Alphaproteobacteria bacterium]|nr:DUF4265 domain-containing protein [Alphaproteobacteria bacterium]
MTQNSADQAEHVKVEFRVPNEDGGVDVETMWAQPRGDDLYMLDNTPFYAYGISNEDIFRASHEPNMEFPVFHSIYKKSGNRTLRIMFTQDEAKGSTSQSTLDYLNEMGCAYEGADASFYAITIPADTDLFEIATFLTDNEIMWEHSDPKYDDIYPKG